MQSTDTTNYPRSWELNDPSKQIRLIEIKAQQPNMPLELNLSVYSLIEAPNFYAVSYTWGSGILSEKVLINKIPMMVTENCYYALSQIHLHFQSSTTESPESATSKRVYLWIDSICINQNDMKEKGFQVAMMFEIYMKAIKVLACIGPHQNDSERLIEVLEEIKSFDMNLYSSREEILQDGIFQPNMHRQNIRDFVKSKSSLESRSSESFGIRLRKAVLAFANRDYWTRLWIIQEVAATGGSGNRLEVLCGTDRLSRSEVYLLFYIAHYMADNPVMNEAMSIILFIMDEVTVRSIMAHQVFCFTNDTFKCSRPEDKIYGLLPLIKWRDNFPPMRPVYHEAATFDLAKALICQTDWMKPFEIKRILKALEICYRHGWMRDLIAMRSGCVSPTENTDDNDPIHRFSGTNHLVLIIGMDDHNRLTASLVHSNPECPPLSIVDEKAANLREFPSKHDETQLLFTRSRPSALICGAAQVGDLIIQTGYGRGLLILRYTDNQELCTIVGQGLLCMAYEFPGRLPERVEILERRLQRFQTAISHPKELSPFIQPDDRAIPGMTGRQRCEKRLRGQVKEARSFSRVGYMTNIQLKTKPVDMVVLAGQDMEKDGSHNADESLQRLSTAIKGTVRLVPMAN